MADVKCPHLCTSLALSRGQGGGLNLVSAVMPYITKEKKVLRPHSYGLLKKELAVIISLNLKSPGLPTLDFLWIIWKVCITNTTPTFSSQHLGTRQSFTASCQMLPFQAESIPVTMLSPDLPGSNSELGAGQSSSKGLPTLYPCSRMATAYEYTACVSPCRDT